MLGKLLGKVAAAPIRLANVPLRAMDKAVDAMTGVKGERIASEPGDIAANAVEDSVRETIDYILGDDE